MNLQILRLAIPNIISNISVPLISAVDTALMGHLGSSYLAALGIGAMIFVFIYGSFSFLRVGTTGIAAQAFGANDSKLIANTLSRAVVVAILVSLALILFKNYILEISVYLMNVEDIYYARVESYFNIRIYTAPAVMLQWAIMGWFFGMQNAIAPLLITLVVNIANILLSFYFVNTLGWGIDGAAYGTLISQYIGVVFGALLLLRYKERLSLIEIKETLDSYELIRFFTINRDIFIRTLFLTFSLGFLYSQAAKDSQDTLAVMVLLLQFMIWMAFALDGFANAAESLVGKYYGAKDWAEFRRAILYSFYWGGGFATLFAIFYYFGGEYILSIYTNDLGLIKATLPYMWLVALLPILSFGAFIWDGVFIGMTASKAMRDAVVISAILFMLLFYATKTIDYSWALWGSFVMFFIFRGAIQSWQFYRYGRELSV